jgi:hypothetical protein
MSVELLNTELVQKLMEERGLIGRWVVQQVGLTRTPGYDLLRDGKLPKDPKRKKEVLKRLSKLFSVDERQLVLRLEAKAG